MKMFGFVLYNKFHWLFWPSPIQTLFNLFSKIQKKCASLYLESKSSHEAIKWMDLTSVTISIVRQCKRFSRSIQSMMAKNHRKRTQPKKELLFDNVSGRVVELWVGKITEKGLTQRRRGRMCCILGFRIASPEVCSAKKRRWCHSWQLASCFSSSRICSWFLKICFSSLKICSWFLKICFSSLKLCCSSPLFLTNLLPAAGLLYNAKAAIASEVFQETSTFMLCVRWEVQRYISTANISWKSMVAI